MLKLIVKILAIVLAVVILAPVIFVASLRGYYLHIVGQKPGNLPMATVQAGELGANVNVFSATGGWPWVCAHNNPAAMTPFGLARVAPDTACMLIDRCSLNMSGYYYGDNKLLGFSHTRFIGTGMDKYGQARILPTVASHAPQILKNEPKKRWVRFSHAQEKGSPGYYAVFLPRDEILAELTATPHCGFHRYTFKKKEPIHILIDATSTVDQNSTGDGMIEVITDKNECEGIDRKDLPLYFVVKFNRPLSAWGTWNGTQYRAGVAQAAGIDIGADVSFSYNGDNPVLELRVGLSNVSMANARENLEKEIGAAKFDEIAARARDEWETRLSTIQVTGGTDRERRIFYTALFRCFEMPTRFADVNGEYMGFDDKVHKEEGYKYYTDFSLWDTFRTVHPLYTLIAPKDQRDMMVSMVEMAKINKCLPRWPAGARDTGSMFGTPADIAVSEAYLKGIRDFDANVAYEAMCQTALRGVPQGPSATGRNGLEHYLSYHYCPADQMDKGVAATLEYTWADYAISQFADALGKKDDAAMFLDHSRYYRNTWNDATQFFQPRDSQGRFMEFKPLLLTYWEDMSKERKYTRAYVEGSAEQWRWGVPFDPDGLISLFSSRDYFVKELETYFEKSTAPLGAWNPGGYYWHGNEPYFHAPYLFNHAGRPDLTQKWVRWICDTMYADDYIGLAGNDDAATISAWYVLSALGFYPIAGTAIYELGVPLFERAEVKMGDYTLTIVAENFSPQNRWVQRAELNDKALEHPWFTHDQIAKGGTLKFVMSPTPVK